MERNVILQSDINDIIFENRNKAYGAYELRKNYERRAKKALTVMMLFTMMIVSVPLLAGLMGGKSKSIHIPKYDTILIRQYTEPKLPVKQPIQKPSVPKPAKSSIPVDIIVARDLEPLVKPPLTTPSVGSPTASTSPDPGPSVANPYTEPGGSPTAQAIIDPEPSTVYTDIDVQQLPEFPGGEDALLTYLSTHIQYPPKAVSNDIEGRIILGFVVNKEGNIDEIKVLKGIGYGCDDEAIRVIGSMPKWKPGRNNGKAVSVYFNLPVTFELSK